MFVFKEGYQINSNLFLSLDIGVGEAIHVVFTKFEVFEFWQKLGHGF